MRKVLAGFVVVVAASWLAVGCSSGSSSNGTGGSTGSGTGGSTGGGTGGAGSGTGGSTGGGTGGAGDCTLPSNVTKFVDNESEHATMCKSCLQTNCCAAIAACYASNDCWGIKLCQAKCYSGNDPDGGVLPEDDAGIKNDAGNTPRDQCAEDCLSRTSMATMDLFGPMDDCWEGLLPGTQCGDPLVCD